MGKFLLTLLVFLGISIYVGNSFSFQHERVLRVGTECDYAPNNWEEDHPTDSNVPLINKKDFYAEGYDIQIAKIVAESIGAKLEVKKIAWENLIPALNRNEIDIIFSGMLDTSERRQLISFTDTYEDSVTEYGILVQKDGKWSDAKNLTDFKGARFVGQADTNLDTAIDQLIGVIHLPPVISIAEMFEAINGNNADGIITDYNMTGAYVKTYPNLKAVRLSKDATFVFDYSGVCAGVRKTDKKLVQEINRALKKISPHERQKIMDRTIARDWKNLI